MSGGDKTYDFIYAIASCIFLLLFGSVGVGSCHPCCNRPYGRWLKQTPWKWPQPLPLGDPGIEWQNLITVTVFAAISPEDFLWALVTYGAAFSIGYVGMLFTVASAFDETFLCNTVIFAPGAILALCCTPEWESVILLALLGMMVLVVSQVSLRRVLRRFDEIDLPQEKAKEKASGAKGSGMHPAAGSPYSELLAANPSMSLKKWSWNCAAVVCWYGVCVEIALWRFLDWTDRAIPSSAGYKEVVNVLGEQVASLYYFLTAVQESDPSRFITAGVLVGLLMLPLVMVLVFAGSQYAAAPPITWWGRVGTGRLIIPGYDIVHLSWVSCFLSYALVCATLLSLGTPLLLSFTGSIACSFVCLAFWSDFLESWRYTGHYRIVTRKS